MKIGKLLQHEVSVLEIEGTYNIPKKYYEKTEIIELKPVKIKGRLQCLEQSILLNAEVTGNMIISDSVSLEPVNYPFSFQIDEDVQEKVKNDENTLAIIDILWENIVLEIPIRYSEVNDYSNFSGDGWSLIAEENYQKPIENNPFRDLLEELEEEEK